MPKQDSEQTPEGRITRKFLATLRQVQNRYPVADIFGNLVHASHSDLEEGIRKQVRREILQAQHDILQIPYARWESERRRIAAELAKIDE